MFADDMDGDGDLDVLSASRFDDRIVWFENSGGQSFTARMINPDADGARSVFAVDVDSDGDLDVLSASFKDDKIVWYAQNQVPVFTSPTSASVAEGTQLVLSLLVSDGDVPAQAISFVIDDLNADNHLFEIINGNELRFVIPPDFENPTDIGSDNIYQVRVLADDGNGGVTSQTILVTVLDVLNSVVSKDVFYNNSSFDSGSNGQSHVDAIDLSKTPLRNGEVATFANYTSYSKGINGLMFTVEGLSQTPTLATVSDFLVSESVTTIRRRVGPMLLCRLIWFMKKM